MDFDQILGTFFITVLYLSVSSVEGYFVNIDANAEECFFEKATSGTKMSLTFEVAEGGFLDIDVRVITV